MELNIKWIIKLIHKNVLNVLLEFKGILVHCQIDREPFGFVATTRIPRFDRIGLIRLVLKIRDQKEKWLAESLPFDPL